MLSQHIEMARQCSLCKKQAVYVPRAVLGRDRQGYGLAWLKGKWAQKEAESRAQAKSGLFRHLS